jgi:hypothetical protein
MLNNNQLHLYSVLLPVSPAYDVMVDPPIALQIRTVCYTCCRILHPHQLQECHIILMLCCAHVL